MKKKTTNIIEKKNYEFIETFVKGIIIGLSNLIPGISAGTIAITLGMYEKIINSVSNLKKEFKSNAIFLMLIVVGMILGLLGFSNVISYGMNNFPLATKLLFLGLIFGGLPILYKEIKNNYETKNITSLVISMLLVVGLSLLSGKGTLANLSDLNILALLKLLLVGMVAAVTMVVPGISGSLMLVLLGYFEPIVNTLKSLSHGKDIINNSLPLIPFGIGVLVGVVLAVKLIKYLLNNFKVTTYFAIVGFVLGSIITILISINYNASLGEYMMGIGMFILGLLGGLKLGEDR